MNAPVRFWLGVGTVLALVLALVTWGLLHLNLNTFSQRVSDRLLLLAELRRGAIQEYFNTARAELRFWSINPELLDAQQQLVALWQSDDVAAAASRNYIDNNPHPAGDYLQLQDAGDGSPYSELHRALHPQASLFVTERGYYDFFLISPDGDVMYTVEKEADFATNLRVGPWKNTGLAEVFRRASSTNEPGAIVLSDMRAYPPSNEAPAIFMATPMQSDDGTPLGVIAFQLPTGRILSIMNYTAGMGESGETYLVGPDQLMRSNSRFSELSTVLKQTVDGPTVNSALDGGQQIDIVDDYRGVPVLSVALPMPVGDVTWAVMAEIDQAEVEQEAANAWPNIAAPMGFVYALSLWSVWYWRNRKLPEDDQADSMAVLEYGVDGVGVDA